MNSLKKVADKLSTNSSSSTHEPHAGLRDASGTVVGVDSHAYSTTTVGSGVVTGERITTTSNTVQTGHIVDQRQVGTVDVVETVQQIKKVPIIETTREVETLNTGVASLDIHQHAHVDKHTASAHHLHTTSDSKTVVVEPVVEEVLRRDRLVQVQPVIHQEVVKEEVHHIVKHINEAPAPSLSGQVTLNPVIQEHVHTHVIEEIHPVIHREIALQEVEVVQEHITEHIVAPTKHIHEVIVEKEVLPVHSHDHHCHHEVSTERLTNVIVPGAAVVGSASTVGLVKTREVLVDQAAPVAITGKSASIVAGSATTLATDQHLVTDRHLATGVVTDRHLATDVHTTKTVGFESERVGHAHTLNHGGALHTDTVVETTEFVEGDAHAKKHHHLHLPHLHLHSHKKEGDVVVTEEKSFSEAH